MNNKKKLILVLLASLAIIGVTAGVTLAFLSYTKEGVKENTITTGAITFHYNEDSNQGISLDNALPLSDGNGQSQNKYFDFTITSNNGSEVNIPYMITTRKVSNQSTEIDNQYIKVYLTKVTTENDIDSENQVLFDTYNNLSTVVKNNHNEEVLWTDSVLAGNTNYSQKYRLRIWLSSNMDFSPLKDSNGNYMEENGEYVYPNNDKEFSIKVNVYSGSQTTLTPAQQQAPVTAINIGNSDTGELEANEVDNPNYDYQVSMPPGTESATITVDTEDEYANVKIEKIADPSSNNTGYNYEKPRVERMAINKTVSLETGDNYFRVTIIPTTGSQTQYILKVKVETAPGFYAEDGTIITWNELVNTYGLNSTNVNNGTSVLNAINKKGKLVLGSSVTSIGWRAFYNCSKLIEIEMPDTIQLIDGNSFEYCSELTTVTLPLTLKTIGSCAFQYASKLENIVLPEGLTKIDGNAFSRCSALTTINIPSTVTTINWYAFSLSGLTSVTFAKTTGWFYSSNENATSGTNISSETLANPTSAANALRNSYSQFYIKNNGSN